MPPRPVDSTLHGVVDYSAGALLMTAFPKLAGIEGTRSARQIRRAGTIHAGYSTLTDYPLGVVKAIPFQAHLAIDAIGALALAATPFVTGQYRQGRREWVPHVALCLFRARVAGHDRPDRQGRLPRRRGRRPPGEHGGPASQDLRRRAGGDTGDGLTEASALTRRVGSAHSRPASRPASG
jgi:hypothetical protein